MRLVAVWFLFFCALMTAACPIERLFPDQVADGVARLTVADIGLLLLAIKQETSQPDECDVYSLKQTSNAVVNGLAGKNGSITWTYNGCLFDFSKGITIESDTRGEPAFGTVNGKVTLSGQKTVSGVLTGNPNSPIIPQGKESLQFHFNSAQFDRFNGKLASGKTLTIVKGELSFDATIHLAKDEFLELCQVPLPNFTLKNVEYNPKRTSPVVVSLPGSFGDFEVDVNNSNFSAQRGVYDGNANTLAGSFTVWGETYKIPTDQKGLEEDFSVAAFNAELEKNPDLSQPITYECPVSRFIATTAARLIIQNFALASQQVGYDEGCGFRALKVLKNPIETTDTPPNKRKMVFQTKNCILSGDVSAPFGISCDNIDTYIQGSANYSAIQRVTGEQDRVFLIYKAVIPRTPTALQISLNNVALNNYSAYNLGPDERTPRAKLVLKNGSLSGDISPILTGGRDKPCVFDATTPIATFSNIVLKNATAVLQITLRDYDKFEDQILTFDLDIESAKLDAENGMYQGQGNSIIGEITINGQTYQISQLDGSPLALDPSFTQAQFDTSYFCRISCIPESKNDLRCFSPISEIVGPNPGWKPSFTCPF